MKKLLIAFVASLVFVASLGFAQSTHLGAKWFQHSDRPLINAGAYQGDANLEVTAYLKDGSQRNIKLAAKDATLTARQLKEKFGFGEKEEPTKFTVAIAGNGVKSEKEEIAVKEIGSKVIIIGWDGDLGKQ